MAVKRLASVAFIASVSIAIVLAQPPAKAVISGSVIDSKSGDAVRKAIVTLTLQGGPLRWAAARTDGTGRFQFDGLPAGKYDLRARKVAEGIAIYGVNDSRGLGELIALDEGETLSGVTLQFLRFGSISGHVYDSDGDPVANANVNLLRQSRNLGASAPLNYRGSITDDRGEYRIRGIDPGQYYVRAVPTQTGQFGAPPAGLIPTQAVDQYYGGARDPKSASLVRVGGGESHSGLDFHLTSEPVFEVRGRIAGVPQEAEPPSNQSRGAGGVARSAPGGAEVREGAPAMVINGVKVGGSGIQVTISKVDVNSMGWSRNDLAQGPDHRFQFAPVPVGRYRIDAVLHVGEKTYGASQDLDLHAGSGEILLTLARSPDIQGTLRIEGTLRPEAQTFLVVNPSGPRPNGDGYRIQLVRPGSFQNAVTAQVGPDRRFSLKQVPSGEWQLAVTPVPPGFLKSAQLGDKDVRFINFEVGSDDTSLDIVVSAHTATVEGEIDAASPDSKRAGIVIAPVAGPYRTLTRFYYGIVADAGGKFKLPGIAPGKYKIFALEKMAPGSFQNPEAIDQLGELGQEIDLAEDATLQTHPKLIPLDRAVEALQ